MLIENGCVIARVARVFNIWKFTITTTKLFFTSIEMILALKNNNNTNTYPKYSSFDQGYIVNYWNANKSSITLTMIFTCHFVHDAFKRSDWRKKSDTYTHIFSSSSNWNSIYCFHSQIVPKSKRICNFGQVGFFFLSEFKLCIASTPMIRRTARAEPNSFDFVFMEFFSLS